MTVELLIIKQENALETFTKPEGLDPFIEKVRQEVEDHIPDLTTEKGRKAIASLAAKVAKTKVYLDGVGKDLVSDWKAKAKLVDCSRKSMREELDALKAVARKPLTEWEREEEKRLEAIAAKMKYEDDHFEAIEQNELFDFRKERAERVKQQKLEQQKALDREREERIRKEAEERASQKIKEAEARANRAEEERKQAVIDAKKEKIESEKREKLAAQKAKDDEIKRQENIRKAEKKEQEKIEANRRHIGKIRKQIKDELIKKCNIDEELAKKIVIALTKMDRVTINY